VVEKVVDACTGRVLLIHVDSSHGICVHVDGAVCHVVYQQHLSACVSMREHT